MSNINKDFLDKETTHNLIVEMWNSIAENAEEIRSKDLYGIKKDIFNKLVIKYNLTYIDDLESNRSYCFACIFYNKNFEKDCEKCPFSKYQKIKNTYDDEQHCEDKNISPYKKIQYIDGSRYYGGTYGTPRDLSDWHIEYFKKHCIEICDLFIE